MRTADLLSRVRESPPLARARDAREERRRVPWPDADPYTEAGDRIAIVVVNHNTRELISQLVFSLHRVLGAERFAALVVVDNASTDGSLELLGALDRAGLIHLIANQRQRYHGSGLNQAISWLAARQAAAPAAERVDYVWALDSDTVVMRRDVVADATAAFAAQRAAIVGDSFGTREGYEHLAVCSLMLDPRLAWRRGIAPFTDDGAPEKRLLESATDAGLRLCSFPLLHHSYVLHLGSGTLVEVARGEWRNRFYGWAAKHHADDARTYTNHPLGPRLHAALLAAYAREVPDGTAQELIAACRRPEPIVIAEARPLPPREVLQDLFDRGVDVERYLLTGDDTARGPASR